VEHDRTDAENRPTIHVGVGTGDPDIPYTWTPYQVDHFNPDTNVSLNTIGTARDNTIVLSDTDVTPALGNHTLAVEILRVRTLDNTSNTTLDQQAEHGPDTASTDEDDVQTTGIVSALITAPRATYTDNYQAVLTTTGEVKFAVSARYRESNTISDNGQYEHHADEFIEPATGIPLYDGATVALCQPNGTPHILIQLRGLAPPEEGKKLCATRAIDAYKLLLAALTATQANIAYWKKQANNHISALTTDAASVCDTTIITKFRSNYTHFAAPLDHAYTGHLTPEFFGPELIGRVAEAHQSQDKKVIGWRIAACDPALNDKIFIVTEKSYAKSVKNKIETVGQHVVFCPKPQANHNQPTANSPNKKSKHTEVHDTHHVRVLKNFHLKL